MKRDKSPYKSDKTPEISAAEYRRQMGLDTPNAVPKPKNKYGARRTVIDGEHFPSAFEASVWCLLKQLHGERNVKRYPSVKLPGGVKWKVDFEVLDEKVGDSYDEAKGVETADYKVKLKLYREFGLRPLRIWKGDAKRPFIAEVIYPKNTEAK